MHATSAFQPLRAFLIQPDGMPQLWCGDYGQAEPLSLAVLTQAGLSALEEVQRMLQGAELDFLQTWLGHFCTWMKLSDGAWLRVEHQEGLSREQLLLWAQQQRPQQQVESTYVPLADYVWQSMPSAQEPSHGAALAEALNISVP
jgi:hypothetical protein